MQQTAKTKRVFDRPQEFKAQSPGPFSTAYLHTPGKELRVFLRLGLTWTKPDLTVNMLKIKRSQLTAHRYQFRYHIFDFLFFDYN
jgi:hypothetical protein